MWSQRPHFIAATGQRLCPLSLSRRLPLAVPGAVQGLWAHTTPPCNPARPSVQEGAPDGSTRELHTSSHTPGLSRGGGAP